jgi:hypothetical protein
MGEATVQTHPTARLARRVHVRRWLAALVGALLVLPALGQTPAGAIQQDNDRLPTSDPIDNTPRVQDGSVLAIVRSGNRVFVGGSFTSVQNGGNSTVVTRNRLFSYNHVTGQVDAWDPDMNGSVEALAVSPDGRWLYAAGFFTQSQARGAPRVARWDLATGVRDTNFKPAANRGVNDLQLRGNVLYLTGPFDTVAGSPRAGLAAVDATTGALLPMDLPLSVPQTSGTLISGRKMDVTADGSKLVLVGNFRQIAGADRPQLAVVDLDGAGNGVVDADWRSNSYSATCSSSFDSYLRDVEFSPDGTFFVVNTTGAWGGTSKMCDSSARFETGATGTAITPTWINFTGGDTLYAASVTSEAVYIGGHQRWMNNSAVSRGDTAGPGAVSREGVAALDPRTGLPLRWNPGKERGVGTFEMTVSSDALFIGHDTSIVAGEFRPRLSAFPFGSDVNVDPRPIDLPATLYQGRTDRSLRKADVATGGVTNVATAPSNGIDWRNLRGAFVQNGQLYAWNLPGGAVTRRTFDGTTAGTPTDVVAEAGYVVAPPANFATNVRAAAFHDGRLYYLRSGSSQLFWRWFSLESSIAGSQEFVANSSSWTSVTGIEIAGGQMYLTRTDGRLYRAAVAGGSVSSSFTLVNSSTNWNNGNDLFFLPGVGGQVPDTTPPSTTGRPAATSTTPGEATISWTAAGDDRSTQLTYQVFRDGGATPVGTVTGGTSGTISFTETGLTPGNVHTWTVRAIDAAGNVGPLSLASEPVVIAGQSGPAPLAESDFSDGFARWTGVTGLDLDNGQGSPAAPSAVATPTEVASTARLGLTVPATSSCSTVDVRFTSVSNNARYSLMRLRTAGNASIARVWVDGSGRLSVRNDLLGVRLDTTTNLPVNQWAEVSLCAEVNGAAGRLTLLVDGNQAGTWTTDTGTAAYASFQLGDNEPRTAEIRFDDVRVTPA